MLLPKITLMISFIALWSTLGDNDPFSLVKVLHYNSITWSSNGVDN